MLAYHMVHRWEVLVGTLEPHPNGEHKPDPGIHALNTLALCYLHGVLIYRGTKYSQFTAWLMIRKQLGLLMLFAASIHVRHPLKKSLFNQSMLWKAYLSVAYMSPT